MKRGIITTITLKLESKFPNLTKNYLWRKTTGFHKKLLLYKRHIKFLKAENPELRKQAKTFFSENQYRVEAIIKKLADDKSREVYLSSIKYIQTRKFTDIPEFLGDDEHYYLDKLIFSNDEVYIDCGLGNVNTRFDTLDRFISHCPEYRLIIAFEPNITDFNIATVKYKNHPKIKIFNAGVFNYNGEIAFYEDEISTISSTVLRSDEDIKVGNEKNKYTINVMTIDSLDLEKVTFIKMDIEGSEYEALEGAKNTILRDKPKLAISIYHSNEDMIRIAEFISELLPEYKLFIRQYAFFNETVLYCVSEV